jgi:hypothetical protein
MEGVIERLWAENKTWSPFRPDQLRDYRESLSGLHGQGSLIAIVPSEAVLTVPPDADATISWQTVAELIHQVGTRLSPSEWANPLAPLTPAELRLMYELIMYLERRELAFMDNLGATDVIVAREAERVEEILRAMLQRATQQVGLQTNTDSGPRRRGFFLWQTFAPTAPNWATNLGGYPELALWPDDEWVPSEAQIEDPCFGAGYTFPPGSEFSRLQGADAADWRRSFREEHRVWVGETSGYLRLMSPLYLGELAVRGVTFDEQARALATWAQQSIRLVEERPPPAA